MRSLSVGALSGFFGSEAAPIAPLLAACTASGARCCAHDEGPRSASGYLRRREDTSEGDIHAPDAQNRLASSPVLKTGSLR
jgi:hypothetical protein